MPPGCGIRNHRREDLRRRRRESAPLCFLVLFVLADGLALFSLSPSHPPLLFLVAIFHRLLPLLLAATGFVPLGGGASRFETIFARNAFTGNPTLLQVLGFGGGGLNALSRHAVAALLNAAHPDVDPPLAIDTTAEVIALWQTAFDSGNAALIESTKNIFAAANEAGCIVDAHGNVIVS